MQGEEEEGDDEDEEEDEEDEERRTTTIKWKRKTTRSFPLRSAAPLRTSIAPRMRVKWPRRRRRAPSRRLASAVDDSDGGGAERGAPAPPRSRRLAVRSTEMDVDATAPADAADGDADGADGADDDADSTMARLARADERARSTSRGRACRAPAQAAAVPAGRDELARLAPRAPAQRHPRRRCARARARARARGAPPLAYGAACRDAVARALPLTRARARASSRPCARAVPAQRWGSARLSRRSRCSRTSRATAGCGARTSSSRRRRASATGRPRSKRWCPAFKVLAYHARAEAPPAARRAGRGPTLPRVRDELPARGRGSVELPAQALLLHGARRGAQHQELQVAALADAARSPRSAACCSRARRSRTR